MMVTVVNLFCESACLKLTTITTCKFVRQMVLCKSNEAEVGLVKISEKLSSSQVFHSKVLLKHKYFLLE